ncbi:MAG: BTAD domain-containing putative transcriptional regulator [Streptosporangiaceae bacterium]
MGLWGDDPPLGLDVSLRSCVYGIRKTLPDAGRLRTHPSGYVITAGPGELDLDDFRDLAGRGREALDTGDARLAATLLSHAVDLWRDPPLADLPAVPAREQLLGQRKEAQEALTDARLAVGEHRQMLTDLRAVVASDPLHEHAWAQLITALYRSGARTEALAAFGRLRMTLVSAYGIDPGPELQDLHRRVLADDPGLMLRPAGHPPRATVPPLQRVQPTAGSSTASPGRWQPTCQLPVAVADFTGRAADLDRLLTRLSGEGMAITVVTGMLGVGKTALAVHAAHLASVRFPDGQLYACLDDGGRPRDPQVVLGELLRGLGVTPGSIPAARFEREALYRSVLAGRRVLLLADGASSAGQVRPLLPGTPGSAVVVTSRARLPDLDGAKSIELGSLDPADSARLLAWVSGRGAPEPPGSTVPQEEADAAQAIATACGNLPLALRIAGARLAEDRELTMSALANRLADEATRLDELEVGEASVRTRLSAAAQALSERARRALGLLAGAAGLQETSGSAIAALSNDPGANKVAPELADAGLLDRAGNGYHDSARGYRLHPLVRAYAGELLATDPGLAGSATGLLLASGWRPQSGLASSRRITTRVGDRRTTSPNPARS